MDNSLSKNVKMKHRENLCGRMHPRATLMRDISTKKKKIKKRKMLLHAAPSETPKNDFFLKKSPKLRHVKIKE